MSDAPVGTEVTLLRVTEEAEEDARLLTFLQENDVRPGRMFRITDLAEHVGTLTLDPIGRDSREVTLGLAAAAKLRILPGRADAGLFHRVPERARLAAGPAGLR